VGKNRWHFQLTFHISEQEFRHSRPGCLRGPAADGARSSFVLELNSFVTGPDVLGRCEAGCRRFESVPRKACTSPRSGGLHRKPRAQNEQGGDHDRVAGSKEAEADGKSSEPENQHDQQRYGNRIDSLFIHQPACLPEADHNTQCLGLNRAWASSFGESACILSNRIRSPWTTASIGKDRCGLSATSDRERG